MKTPLDRVALLVALATERSLAAVRCLALVALCGLCAPRLLHAQTADRSDPDPHSPPPDPRLATRLVLDMGESRTAPGRADGTSFALFPYSMQRATHRPSVATPGPTVTTPMPPSKAERLLTLEVTGGLLEEGAAYCCHVLDPSVGHRDGDASTPSKGPPTDSQSDASPIETAPHGADALFPAAVGELDLFGSGDGLLTAGLRHSAGPVYNVYSLGSYLGPDGPRPALGLGLGFQYDASRRLQFSADVTGYAIFPKTIFVSNPGSVAKLRPALNWRISSHLALYLSTTITVESLDPDGELGSIAPPDAWKVDVGESRRFLLWPGLGIGLRIF